jgi:large conductance mechanosensitive channel
MAVQSSLLGDFKSFILKGNVLDLAVAVILGGAFAKIVESFIKDVITPAILVPLFKASGAKDVESIILGDGIKVGLFFSAIINFLVVGLVMFFVVKAYETAKKKLSRAEAAAAPADPVAVQQQLISSIDRLNNTVSQKV